jgi:opacity protein-like surface antigen
MKKFLFSLVMLVALTAFAGTASAQKTFDGYVGAQVVRVNPDVRVPSFKFDKQTDSIGANASLTGFVTDNVGVTGEIAGTTKNGTSVITGLAGLTIQARRDKTVQPFVRGLAGLSREAANNELVKLPLSRSDFGFAFAVGAGVDVRVSKNVAIRILQADYLQTHNFGERQDNLRLGAGIRF